MSVPAMVSLVAIVLGIVFIVIRSFQGHQPFLSCIIATVFVCLLSGLNVSDGIATSFASGTANMLQSMLLFFCACTTFGRLMEETGYAHSIAYFIADHVNAKWAPTIIFLATVVLAMGGMLIATCIIVYPIGMILLSRANYSKRILVGANVSGFWAVTCCSPLIPSAANNLLQNLLGTTSSAGLVPGLATTAFLFITIIAYLQWQVYHWQKKGICFENWDELNEHVGQEVDRSTLPPVWEAILPIVVVLILYNVFAIPVAVAMLAAVVVIGVFRWKQLKASKWVEAVETGLYEGVIPALNLSVMGGFGTVVALTPFYQFVLEWLAQTTINPYILSWGGAAIMAGIIGSSTSAIATLVPSILPILQGYVAQGYDIGVIHRLMCVGSVSLDSLPHNGSLLACSSLMKSNLKESYWPICVTCTILPILGGLCITLPMALLGF